LSDDRDSPQDAALPFHDLVRTWFEGRFSAPTEPQRLGWPAIASGDHTLIAAPTGSGKTLAAFLASIDRLVRRGLDGTLDDSVDTLYVSPLKALSNDVRRNLEVPLGEIEALARAGGLALPSLRVLVRSGDTPPGVRQAMARKPPHILVTTPESLYLILTSPRSREMLRTVRTVIVDEIHALARDKRGSHLALSLARLDALCPARPVRVGLSATQRPLELVAAFLVGTSDLDADGRPRCRIVDAGHLRDLDLEVVVPATELTAVCPLETWKEVYGELAELIRGHRSTLVFVNTRRLAERVAHELRAEMGEDLVASHHGSLSKETRLAVESRLKEGSLKAVVATASLELGIDVGYVDLACQIGSPRAIATFLQRIGRSGHSLGVRPKGRLFPLSRDELLECMALVRAVRAGRLDSIEVPRAPLDILAQQVVAAVACDEWDEDALFELVRRAYPYRNLERRDFDAVVALLSEGFAPGRLRSSAYLHRDRIGRRLRARRHARIVAVTSGGAIPETADYRVVTAEDRTYVGSVNEDFAIESMAGDVFLLGNTSWRIQHVRGGEVVVVDAKGSPATIPFWLGEAPGRTLELSAEVSRLRKDLEREAEARAAASELPPWLSSHCGAGEHAAAQALAYVAAQKAALDVVPSQEEVVFERFFDDSGGMQVVVHAPFGARINRAWGLTLRKCFCRSFNFELQASADDNGVVLSLGPQHSLPLDALTRLVRPDRALDMLVQAVLAVPFFTTRWRWNANRSLAVPRSSFGAKVPPPLQRMRADDLLAAVFPQQTACLENIVGDIEVPDHPLVRQTLDDCLHEAMDAPRWLGLLEDIAAGRVRVVVRDSREPSPFSAELLNARPYAFLDDAPLEERRARAVSTRRRLDVEALRDLASLDPEAVRSVAAEAWPLVRDREELHDALLTTVALPESETDPSWRGWFNDLVLAGRAARVWPHGAHEADGPAGRPDPFWSAAEHWPLLRAAWRGAASDPELSLPAPLERETSAAEASVALVRGRLQVRGIVTAPELAAALALDLDMVRAALEALEGEGFVLRGMWTLRDDEPMSSGARETQWCERRLLARMHRRTLDGLRRRIEPAAPEAYVRFLAVHSHAAPQSRLRGRDGLWAVIAQLAGFEVPAGAWESEVLSARVEDYDPDWLDELASSGAVAWGRLAAPRRPRGEVPGGSDNGGDAPPSRRAPGTRTLTRAVRLALFPRQELAWLRSREATGDPSLAGRTARRVLDALESAGALFPEDIAARTGLLRAEIDGALLELAALGLAAADAFAAVRWTVSPYYLRRAGPRRMPRWMEAIAPPARPSSHAADDPALLVPEDDELKGSAETGAPSSPDASRSFTCRSFPDRPRWTTIAQPPSPGSAGARWARFPPATAAAPAEERVEYWAWLLLRRWGVVFRDLLAREDLAPPWGELVRVYRRLEARGEVRGGRFVLGVGGEQYAMEESVALLRRVRDEASDAGAGAAGEWLVVSAADPLNLSGSVVPGPRVPALHTNAVAFQGGRVVAARLGEEVVFVDETDPARQERIEQLLRKDAVRRIASEAQGSRGREGMHEPQAEVAVKPPLSSRLDDADP
jgi:ATP-dependent Lhr-like helicase